MSEATALLNDLSDAEREVPPILTSMEDQFELSGSPDPESKHQLTAWLEKTFPRVQAGLERYGHGAYAQRLAEDWRRHEDSGLDKVHYQPTDSGGFVECAAWDTLRKAIAVLRDAIAHSEAAHERERQRAEAAAALEVVRDEANHKRMKEVRDADAMHGKERRDDEHVRETQRRSEDRTAAQAEAKRQRLTTIITTLLTSTVGVASVLIVGADKLAVLIHGEQLPEAIVLSGSVSPDGGSPVPVDLMITCEPAIPEVLIGIGENSWSMTVTPSAPRPFQSYCWASGAEVGSDRVKVVVPAPTDASANAIELPTLTLAPRGAAVGDDGGG